jgi:Glycosyltransferase 61
MPSFATEFLELLGIGRERILLDVSEPTVFRSAVLTTLVCHRDAIVHRGVFFALRDAVLAADVSREPSLGERLWIVRGRQAPQKRRDIVNAQEVEECLERHGFTSVDMAGLSVRRQIAAVRNAEVLGGPHGSGLVHSIFLPEAALGGDRMLFAALHQSVRDRHLPESPASVFPNRLQKYAARCPPPMVSIWRSNVTICGWYCRIWGLPKPRLRVARRRAVPTRYRGRLTTRRCRHMAPGSDRRWPASTTRSNASPAVRKTRRF